MDPTFFKRPSSKNVFWGDPGESILEEIKVCFSPNLFPSLKYIFRGGRWSFHGLFRSMMQPWSFSFQSAATGKITDTSAKHGQAHMEILCFESPGTSPPDHSIRKILIDKSWQIPPVSVWKSGPRTNWRLSAWCSAGLWNENSAARSMEPCRRNPTTTNAWGLLLILFRLVVRRPWKQIIALTCFNTFYFFYCPEQVKNQNWLSASAAFGVKSLRALATIPLGLS